MQLPGVPARDTLAGLAALVRECLAEVARLRAPQPGTDAVLDPPFDPTFVAVTAVSAFAANSYARARLLRQLHACGLLRTGEFEAGSDHEFERAAPRVGAAQPRVPR